MRSVGLGPLPGTSYVLVRRLGAGASGEVFEATHASLGKRVAIKLLADDSGDDEARLDRLRAEARLLARITHPALVGVFDLGATSDGRVFFAMEYVDGETAASLVARRGRLPAAEAAGLVADVLDGLAAAHALGIVHRDVKPSNIMVGADGRARIVDFHAAREVDEITETGRALATPSYMAPEQILGRRLSAAADLYSAGCTLFTLLTGEPPFLDQVLEKHLGGSPPTLSERLNEATSTELEALIAQALAKDPHDRPPSAEAMASDLRRIASPNAVAPAPVAPRPASANVRELGTSFLGRARELAAIEEMFAKGDRVVSLVGPGGGGKTRLAKRYAALHVADFAEAGGTWFVSLEDAWSASDVVAKVARVLGTSLASQRDESSAILQLGRVLAGKGPMLLVLDNCEQATGEIARVVAEWSQGAPEVRFLATSRERLGLEGERSYEVAPLPLPDSVALFVDRAQLVRADYVLGEEDVPIVRQIVQALDGIPLAIELGAARMGIMSAAALRDRLGERFELLTSTARNPIARQRTLEAAIEWSWSLLAPWEQAALAQCAVFRGCFTLEAAEAVVDVSGFAGAPPVLEIVQRLRDKSLVYAQSSRDFPSEIRLGLYETIREYALSQLELDAAAERHAAYYLSRGAAWVEHADLGSPEHVRRLTLELENVRAVHARFLGKVPRRALEAAAILHHVLLLGNTPLSAQLALANATIAAAGDSDPDLLGVILNYRCRIWRFLGDAERQRADAAATLELAARTRDPTAEVQARIRLAFFRSVEERIQQSELAIAAARGASGLWQRRALMSLAGARMDNGELEVAKTLYLEVIAASDVAGDRASAAHSLGHLGLVLMEQGRLEEAERSFEEAVAAMHPVFGPQSVAIFRYNLATCRHERGDHGRAERAYRELMASLGDRALVASLSRAALGVILATRDAIDEAACLLDEAEGELAVAGRFAVVVATHRGHLELARARKAAREGDADASARHLRLAERARAASQEENLDDARTARRWLDRALDPTASGSADAWVVASDGSWFRRPHGWRVEVGSRAHAKRVLAALLSARLERPGRALSVDDVLRAGWPDERVLRRAAEARVYNIIKTVRNAGLRELVLSLDGGYALDPAARVLGG